MAHTLKTVAEIALPVLGTVVAPGLGTALGLGADGVGLGAAALSGIGGALGGAAGGAIGGGGLTGTLEGAALGGAGGYLGGGGLSDALGSAGDALGLTGAPAATDAAGSVTSSDLPDLTAARSAVSDAASAAASPSSTLTGYTPGTGASLTGGGQPGLFVSDLNPAPVLDNSGSGALAGNAGTYNFDLDGNPTAPAGGLGSGVGLQPPPSNGLLSQATSLLSPPTNAGNYDYDVNGNAAGASSYTPSQTIAGALAPSPTTATPGGIMPPTDNLANGLLKSGLAYLFQKNNAGGYGALQGAGNQTAANYQPFLAAGQNANAQLADLNGLNGAAAQQAAQQNWQNTPGYQFAFNQGLQALDAGAAARGMAASGNNQQAEQQFGTGLANQYYNQFLGNLQNQAGAGLSAAQGVNTGLTNAAGAYAAGKGQQNGSYNTLLAGLGSSLFPTGGLTVGSNGSGGYTLNQQNPNSGLLNYLFS